MELHDKLTITSASVTAGPRWKAKAKEAMQNSKEEQILDRLKRLSVSQ